MPRTGRSLAPLPALRRMLFYNIMANPLALSAGAGARLVLAGGISALLWLAVAWAMRA